jgi:hypothetical protein
MQKKYKVLGKKLETMQGKQVITNQEASKFYLRAIVLVYYE